MSCREPADRGALGPKSNSHYHTAPAARIWVCWPDAGARQCGRRPGGV